MVPGAASDTGGKSHQFEMAGRAVAAVLANANPTGRKTGEVGAFAARRLVALRLLGLLEVSMAAAAIAAKLGPIDFETGFVGDGG